VGTVHEGMHQNGIVLEDLTSMVRGECITSDDLNGSGLHCLGAGIGGNNEREV